MESYSCGEKINMLKRLCGADGGVANVMNQSGTGEKSVDDEEIRGGTAMWNFDRMEQTSISQREASGGKSKWNRRRSVRCGAGKC